MFGKIKNLFINIKDQDLISFAHKGDIANITMLLKNGADVNFQDERSSETAMHMAVIPDYFHFHSNIDLVKILLKYNAELNIQNIYGETPLHFASKYRDIEIVKLLINKGAYINAKAYHGETPLHQVVQVSDTKYEVNNGNKAKIAGVLIQLGADINIIDHRGRLAFHDMLLPYADTIDCLVDYFIDERLK